MNDLYHTLRTVSVMELQCMSYNSSQYKKNFDTHNLNSDNLAIIISSDDIGYDTGDYDTIHNMHRLLVTDNDLYKIIDCKQHSQPISGKPIHYWYCYLVLTDDVNYLTDFFKLVNIQSNLDKEQYKFNEKYGITKKRKHMSSRE